MDYLQKAMALRKVLQHTARQMNTSERGAKMNLDGIIAAITTPFDQNSDVYFDKLKSNLIKYERIPFKGYLVAGTNGEAPFLSPAERVSLVKFVRNSTNKLIIGGSTAESTEAACDLTKQMMTAGADAVLVMPPFYFKKRMIDEAIAKHYLQIADTCQTPIILYNNPFVSGIDLSLNIITKLAEHPLIVGVKDSDIRKSAVIVQNTRGYNFEVLTASAGYLLGGFFNGCAAGMVGLAGILGNEVCSIHQLFMEEKYNEAAELQRRMCKPDSMTELSQNLQQLSEKARSTTEFIQRLKGMSDKIGEHCIEFEEAVIQEVNELMAALEARKLQLIEYVRQERDAKIRTLKDQVAACTSKLQHTTALMHFCIEALKENDSSSFLQVGTMLISRVANEDMIWYQDPNLACPRVSPYCDLNLDHKPLARAIEQLNFIQMKPAKDGEERLPAAPNAPIIIPEECSAENNSVTVAWQPPPTSYVEGYVLELDDGNGGEFREVYCGKETICTVDGMHFNSTYNARVKAFNSSGEGDYSEIIGLQTAEVAWFTFDPCISGPDLRFSEDNCSVSACEGYEQRVALGSVGFSRGVHYWEFTIDRYDTDTDPSFGIARIDVTKDQMLGKDEKGWGMYIDRQRSWFVHAKVHGQRCEGGIMEGSTVGVLLDLNRHQVSFYVNEEPHGPIAFHNLYGVFYPAVSVNRGVTVTLHTALDIPSDIEDA